MCVWGGGEVGSHPDRNVRIHMTDCSIDWNNDPITSGGHKYWQMSVKRNIRVYQGKPYCGNYTQDTSMGTWYGARAYKKYWTLQESSAESEWHRVLEELDQGRELYWKMIKTPRKRPQSQWSELSNSVGLGSGKPGWWHPQSSGPTFAWR